MLLLLYDKRSAKKFELLRWATYISDSIVSISQISNEIDHHPNTTRRLLQELNDDLEADVFEQRGTLIIVHKENLHSLHTYYQKLIVEDIFYQILNELVIKQNRHTLDSLANELFVSRSKLYTVIKTLNSKMRNFNVKIIFSSVLIVKGELFSIMNLIYELLLCASQKKIMNLTTENIIKEIYSSFQLSLTTKASADFHCWLDTFLLYKEIKSNSRFDIDYSYCEKINFEAILTQNDYCTNVKRLNSSLKNSDIEKLDYFIIFCGLFLSDIFSKNIKRSQEFFNLQCTIFEKFFSWSEIENIKKDFLSFLGIENDLEKNSNRCITNGIQIVLQIFPIFKLHIHKYLRIQNIIRCPEEIKKELHNLINCAKYFKKYSYSHEDRMDVLELFWHIFRISQSTLNVNLIKGIQIKSVFGFHQEEKLKKKIIDSLFNNKHCDTSLCLVDDPKYLTSSSTLLVDSFIEELNNIMR